MEYYASQTLAKGLSEMSNVTLDHPYQGIRCTAGRWSGICAIELWPTNAAASNPRIQIHSVAIGSEQWWLGQWIPVSLSFAQFPTQDQLEKVKESPLTNHIKCPTFSGSASSFSVPTCLIRSSLKPSLFSL